MKRSRAAAALAALCPPRKRGERGAAAAALAAASSAADDLNTAGREALSLQEVVTSSVLHVLGQFEEPFEGTFEELAEMVEDAAKQLAADPEFEQAWVRSCLNVFLALGLLEETKIKPVVEKKTGEISQKTSQELPQNKSETKDSPNGKVPENGVKKDSFVKDDSENGAKGDDSEKYSAGKINPPKDVSETISSSEKDEPTEDKVRKDDPNASYDCAVTGSEETSQKDLEKTTKIDPPNSQDSKNSGMEELKESPKTKTKKNLELKSGLFATKAKCSEGPKELEDGLDMRKLICEDVVDTKDSVKGAGSIRHLASTLPLGLSVRRDQDHVLTNIDMMIARVLHLEVEKQKLEREEESALKEVFQNSLEHFEAPLSPDSKISGPKDKAEGTKLSTPNRTLKDAAEAAATAAAITDVGDGLEPGGNFSRYDEYLHAVPAGRAIEPPVRSAKDHSRHSEPALPPLPDNNRTRFFLPGRASLMPIGLEKELETNASVSSRNVSASNSGLGFTAASSSIQYSSEMDILDVEAAARLKKAREHINRVREVVFQSGPRVFDQLLEARQRFLATQLRVNNANPNNERSRSESLDESLDSVRRLGPRDGPKVRAPKFLPSIQSFVGPSMGVQLHEELDTRPFDFADIVVQFRVSGTDDPKSSSFSPLARVKSVDSMTKTPPLEAEAGLASPGANTQQSTQTAKQGSEGDVRNFEDAAKKTAEGTDVDLPSWREYDWRKDPETPGPFAPLDDWHDEAYTKRHMIAREEASAEWEAHLEEKKRLKEEERVRRQSLSHKARSPRDRRKSTPSGSPRSANNNSEDAVRRLNALSRRSRIATEKAAAKEAAAAIERTSEELSVPITNECLPVDIPTVDSLEVVARTIEEGDDDAMEVDEKINLNTSHDRSEKASEKDKINAESTSKTDEDKVIHKDDSTSRGSSEDVVGLKPEPKKDKVENQESGDGDEVQSEDSSKNPDTKTIKEPSDTINLTKGNETKPESDVEEVAEIVGNGDDEEDRGAEQNDDGDSDICTKKGDLDAEDEKGTSSMNSEVEEDEEDKEGRKEDIDAESTEKKILQPKNIIVEDTDEELKPKHEDEDKEDEKEGEEEDAEEDGEEDEEEEEAEEEEKEEEEEDEDEEEEDEDEDAEEDAEEDREDGEKENKDSSDEDDEDEKEDDKGQAEDSESDAKESENTKTIQEPDGDLTRPRTRTRRRSSKIAESTPRKSQRNAASITSENPTPMITRSRRSNVDVNPVSQITGPRTRKRRASALIEAAENSTKPATAESPSKSISPKPQTRQLRRSSRGAAVAEAITGTPARSTRSRSAAKRTASAEEEASTPAPRRSKRQRKR